MTLQEIAPYLAYGLRVFDEDQESKTDKIVGVFHDTLDFENWSPTDSKIDHYKYVLRPLSDLTKPVLEGGKIPIVELAKIAFPKCSIFIVNKLGRVDLGTLYCFGFKITEKSFNCMRGFNGKRWDIDCFVGNQLQLFQKLFEWHFWLGDQSRFGQDIIDINTLIK